MDKDFLLTRFWFQKAGTFGVFTLNGDFLAFSVEQPYRQNLPFHSCIPEGVYDVEPWQSDTHGDVVVLVNPTLGVHKHKEDDLDRYACLIHVANWPRNVEGCIGPGSSLRYAGGEYMVTDSRDTLDGLMDTIRRENLSRLRIKNGGDYAQ